MLSVSSDGAHGHVYVYTDSEFCIKFTFYTVGRLDISVDMCICISKQVDKRLYIEDFLSNSR